MDVCHLPGRYHIYSVDLAYRIGIPKSTINVHTWLNIGTAEMDINNNASSNRMNALCKQTHSQSSKRRLYKLIEGL